MFAFPKCESNGVAARGRLDQCDSKFFSTASRDFMEAGPGSDKRKNMSSSRAC